MPIRVVEIHHSAVRIKGDEADLQANLDFYQGLLGLSPDGKRPISGTFLASGSMLVP